MARDAVLRGFVVCLVASVCLCLNPQHYILETDKIPGDDRFRPTIGNGHVATNALSDTVFMNGVMNGNESQSHRARIPATSSIDVIDDGDNTTRLYTLNMLTGVFTQTITRPDVDIRLQYFAHRTMTRLLVTILTVHRRQPGDVTLDLSVNRGGDSEDLEDLTTLYENNTLMASRANIEIPEVDGGDKTNIFQYCTLVPDSFVLEAGKDSLTSVYITSTSTEQMDSEVSYQRALSMTADELLQTHVDAWRDLWEDGHLEVNGDIDLARSLNAGLYYILSSTPLKPDHTIPFKGLSPGGLSRGGITFPNKTTPYNDYYGHVFWDMDTWILPPIMALHPQLASILIGSRSDILPTVRRHANSTGYKGARFPWEQGASGGEVCPWPPATIYQIHVTADVSLALRQYLYATDDVSILTKRKGLELAMDIARFWKSRVVKNEDNKYEILGVMGPDEYHFNVDNSVFTNYNAKLSLQLPAHIRDTYNPSLSESEKEEIKEFSEIGSNMLILFDEDKQYHPQFQGFFLNESIKQSDVVLLGFPLMMPMSPEVRRNDLLIYENLTDQFGPDTGTWSMHTLTRLELDDEEAAAEDFRMMFRNINGPFKVFSEKPPNNPQGVRAVNFITGAGGLLQAIIFGYGGIRLHSYHLEIRPHLLPKSTEWAIRGLHYRGFKLDIEIIAKKYRMSVLNEMKDTDLYWTDENNSSGEILKLGVVVERPLTKVKISAQKQKSPALSACVFSSGYSCTNEQFILETDDFPDDDRFRPAIGNGHVATNALSDTVFMNGVMNGNGSMSHRARIPATSSIDVTDNGSASKRHYSLDMLKGVFTQTITRPDADIRLQYFAHRTMTRLLVTILTVHRRQAGDVTLDLSVNRGGDSEDLEDLTLLHENNTLMVSRAYIKIPEVADTDKTSIFQYCHPIPDRIVLEAGKDSLTSVYITSTGTEQTDTEVAYQRALTMSPGELLQTHVEAWRNVWEEGSIQVGGDLNLARSINAGLYYILSSTPLKTDQTNPFTGLSPGGLSRGGITSPTKTTPYNDYYGHVFWDMDTWILPPIMALHPQLASIMIGSRSRVLPTVKQHAIMTGYKGARFPWEQGATGSEVCPWPPATIYQIHVTADVSLALRQYLYATDDVSILTDRKGLELAMDIARFWKSRVVKNGDNLYEILGVMGPDEYHFNIDNSVFTNYNAKLSLQLPAHIRDTYNPTMSESEKEEIKEFSEIGEKMLILFDQDKQYHPQFQGFSLNESIKQSDVVLLGFPLMMPMSPEVRRNDILIYENLTDQFGPDTGTWSMHTLTRLELDDEDEAAEDFRMMFRNINGPFKVFSEKPPNNHQGVRAVNFITGAGGLLQAVIFGYGGIRLHSDHLEIRPHLLPKSTEWAIRGLHYRGFKLDIEIIVNKYRMSVMNEMKDTDLYWAVEKDSSGEILKLGMTVERPLTKLILSVHKRKAERAPACVFSSSHSCTNQQYILETDEFPTDDRFKPAIGNGHVATNALSDTVFMNGVMNGNGSRSHRARIQATSSIDVIDGSWPSKRHYSLDMLRGVFTQTITRPDADIRLQYFAHRTMTRLLVTILIVHRRQAGDVTLDLSVNRGGDSEDLEDLTTLYENNTLIASRTYIRIPEVTGTKKTNVFQYCTKVPDRVRLEAGKDSLTSVYITSTSTEKTDTELAYQRALSMSTAELLKSHVEAWRELWEEGRLEVNGDIDLARSLNAGMYYILSSTPLKTDHTNPFAGLSPGGLSRGGITSPTKTTPYNDYYGHVFWDMDTWILPPIMALHPQLASIMIGSRSRTLPTVRQHAILTGYKGARFPWEQGASGGEVCPWPPATIYQIHVTADVSLALRQYLYATDDVSILTDRKGLELAMDIARFWKSRVVKNGDNLYEILGVMGPDEYHFNIDNSVFTNYNAKLSLQLPAHIRDTYNPLLTKSEEDEIRKFSEIGSNMLILFDDSKQYHPQFQGFSLNESIKQSDVVLLGFPLMMPMSPEVRRNDLLIYENLTDQFGPDTGTWSMHTLTRLELDDEEEAAEDFRMMFRNINGPFKVFSEKPSNNPQGVRAVNFITGAGGLLQAVIFGYGGIRLHSDHLEIRPHLLPKSTEWAIRGLHYRGFKLDIEITANKYRLSVLNEMKDTYLYWTDEKNSLDDALKLGIIVERPLSKVNISVKKVKTKPPVSITWRAQSSACVILIALGLYLYFVQ